ncbi:uncharacterized protein LOC128725571 [Anopheles nili]|uniref:uncharacterized protein LOC128725571 n=1 Tax=Anopheles nili TaxID=185578 RepID=UPI00237A79E5|nr:uncharacterized protein LOC128725571 [Anopheles nili]
MGIRYLQTFMDRKVKGGIYSLRIENEIKNALKRNQKPLIVIDLMALFGLFSSDKQSLLCGSQVWLMERKAGEFFERLTKAGAELVFFYDGSVQQIKYETWVKRQNDKYDRMIDVIDAINRRTPLAQIVEQCVRKIHNNTQLKLKRVAMQHGKCIVSMHVECDQALAAYATEHNALAVISHDTDFLIFPGEWQLWSSDHLDCNELTTRGYNRPALVRTLGLRWPQMAVWATLAGNDFFTYEEVQPFHQSLGQHYQIYYKLVEYVRTLPIKNKLQKAAIPSIIARVYKNRPIPADATECFTSSLTFYQIDEQSLNANPPMEPMKAFLLEADHQFVYNILTGARHHFTLYYFDYRSTEFGNYFEIVKPIISRIGGIILYHHRDERQHLVVAAQRSHGESHCVGDVPATFPNTITPPPIMELLSPDPDIRARLLDVKLQLLCWVCSDNLLDQLQDFLNVPSSLMVTVLVLYRLRQYGVLRIFEADLLLLIAHQHSTGEFDSSQEPQPDSLLPRAFRLCFLFQKVYTHFARVAKAIGLQREYRPSMPYDGHRFHNQYRVWNGTRIDEHQLAPIAAWRLYTKAEKAKKNKLKS